MGCVWSGLEIETTEGGHRYRLQKMIASGGFSQIFLADVLEPGANSNNEKIVAVKKIVCHSAHETDRVRREIQMTRRFQHSEAVVNLLGWAEDELLAAGSKAVVFTLVFPLCRLGSLQDELLRRGPKREWFEVSRIWHLFRQICSAIDALHAAKPPVAHRDLKPGNLLFLSADRLQLIDFGSAIECPVHIGDVKKSRSMLDEAAELCTMPYRAPELFTCEIGATIDESVDIWSLGCVLYALCFFTSPFDAVHERGDSVALAAQSARFQFPKDSPYDTSLTGLITALIQPLPKDRPPITAILAQVDETILGGFSAGATSTKNDGEKERHGK